MLVNLFNRIKESIAELFRTRLIILIFFFFLLFLVLVYRLFTLQIVNGEDYLENYTFQITKTKETQGTRGNIYDRDGEILASNRLAYSVQIEDNGSYENTEQKNKLINETINLVIDMVESNGDSVVDNFGITLDENEEYQFVYAEGTRRLRFIADIYGYSTIDELSKKERNSTPDDIMSFLCANKRETKMGTSYGFGVDTELYDKSRTLQIITVRYGMHLNSYKKYIPTMISSDVSDETVAMIKENQYELQGISIGEESLREYSDSIYFASIIGYIGTISQEEYDALSKEQQKKYSLTDKVGKAGIEQLMDEYLQGEKGEEIIYVNNVGKVIEREVIKEPKAGNDVYLTIDKDMQITAYKLLEEKLAGIILRKMSNVLDYTRNPNISASNIIIPVGDIYYSFIGNEILDIDHFAHEKSSATEKAVYAKFSVRQENMINNVISNLQSPTSLISILSFIRMPALSAKSSDEI